MTSTPPDLTNPFPGLRCFLSDEDYLFFGRHEQIEDLLRRLRTNRLVAVVGTSGSGKSSLVRAGLLPSVLGGGMSQTGSAWEIAVMRPGGSPMAHLARALCDAGLYDADAEDAQFHLQATLSRSRNGLIEAVRQSPAAAGSKLLLVVDQFEELFRFNRASATSQEEAIQFVNLLLQATQQAEQSIYVVLTMRSDFLGECSQFLGLAEAVNDGEFLIPRMTRDQIQEAIQGPIRVRGAEIAPRLLFRLLNDVEDNQDQLPVLQHALMRTWDLWAKAGQESGGRDQGAGVEASKSEIRNPKSEVGQSPLTPALSPSEGARENFSQPSGKTSASSTSQGSQTVPPLPGGEGRGEGKGGAQTTPGALPGKSDLSNSEQSQSLLTSAATRKALDLQHYEATGGMHQALSRHADEIFDAFPSDEHRTAAARIFKALTERGPDGRGIRRPTRLSQLIAIAGVAPSIATAVIEAYRAPGVTFLMPPVTSKLDDTAVIDISHESLMRVWSRLRSWVEEEAQSARIYRRLQESAVLHGEKRAGRYHDPDLQIALSWRETSQPNAAWAGQYGGGFDEAMAFLDASCEAAQREEREREANRQKELERARQFAEAQAKVARLFKRFAGSLAVGLCCAVVLTIWAFQLRQEAQTKKKEAEAQRSIAQRTAYNASISSVQTDWEKRNYRRVRETLASQKDYAEPSFEWFYWQRMMHLESSWFATYASGIRAYSLSRDGRKVVMVMSDGSVEVRSVPAGEKLVTFLGHTDYVAKAAISPDGKLVASCGGLFFNGEIKLWNAETGAEIRSFGEYDALNAAAGQDDPIELDQSVGTRQYAVAFSPDGRFLASGGAHGRFGVQIWEVATGKKVRMLEEGNDGGWITHLVFSHDGKLVFCNAEGALRFFDAETGELLGSMGVAEQPPLVHAFALSPDSRRLAVSRNGLTVYDLSVHDFSRPVWELPDNSKGSATLASEQAGHLAFSPDGQRLVGSGNGDSVIYSALTGERQLTLRGGNLLSEFLPDSQRVISTDGDRRVKICDASTNRELVKMTTGYVPMAIARDGSRLMVLLPEEGMEGQKSEPVRSTGGVGVLDTATGKLISQMREHEPSHLDGAAFSRDGKWAASGARDGTFRVWDALTGKVKQTIETPNAQHYEIGFGPKGDTIISRTEQPIRGHAIWDIATGEEIFSPRSAIDERNWAMRPDGRRLAACDAQTGYVRIWDPAKGEELRKWKAHASQQFEVMMVHNNESMDYSADGRRLVTAGFDGLVKLWDPETGKLERTITGHVRAVVGVHFTPDQRRIISQGRDGTVRIWDPATGKELLSLTDPLFERVWTWYVAVSQDGRKVYAAPGFKKEMIIWEAATPEQVAAWRQEEEADAALWAAEEPKVEERRIARIEAATAKQKAAEEKRKRQIAEDLGLLGEAPQHQPSKQTRPLVPGDSGAIRQWLVLAPLPLSFRGDDDRSLLKQQIPDEALLRPREGEHSSGAPETLAWAPVQLGEESYQLNFVELVQKGEPGRGTDNRVAYAVTYVVSESPQSNITMLVGSDDTARVYLNEKEVYRSLDMRGWKADDDEVNGLELKAGLNVVVFKVVNGTQGWAGSVRFVDAAGKPLPGIKVTLDPGAGK